MTKGFVVNTPYDDVFRTMLNDCSRLIIPVINEIFCENYRGDEKIVFSPEIHFVNQQDGEETKRITDSSFEIIGEKETEKAETVDHAIPAFRDAFSSVFVLADAVILLDRTGI